MAISAVGTFATNFSSTGGTTLPVSPTTVGDLMVVWANIETTGGGPTWTGVSGGGVSTWTQITTGVSLTGVTGFSASLWFGTITTTGSSTLTFTGSTAPGGSTVTIFGAQQFTAGLGTNTLWAIDGTQSAVKNNTTNSTTVTFPTLTPGGSGRLYVGNMMAYGTLTTITSGYTLKIFTASFPNNGGIWNASVSTVQTPTSHQSISDPSNTIGGLIVATQGPNPGQFLPFFM